ALPVTHHPARADPARVVFRSATHSRSRPFGEQSSVSDNVTHTRSENVSEEMRLRSDLWHDLIHSSNQTFSSVEQLRMDLSRYAISRVFDYHFIRNEQTRVTIACKVTTCQWSLHAIRIGC
ncbi:hypothetical protein Taro_034605, partial [Colocasia esculenta]|nr:hypothetical protein [Colocasia esculenta]